ncbi:MAG: hypothetical protein QXQ46_10860 [Thermoplasmatales archaeon]
MHSDSGRRMIGNIPNYDELFVVSKTPSFLIQERLENDERISYREKILERIYNVEKEPTKDKLQKETTLYLSETGFESLKTFPIETRKNIFQEWRKIVEIAKNSKGKLKINVIAGTQIPPNSIILGKFVALGDREMWDVFIEYRVAKPNLRKCPRPDDFEETYFVYSSLTNLPEEIKWIRQEYNRMDTQQFEKWMEDSSHVLSDTLVPPPTEVIFSAISPEIMYYRKKLGKKYNTFGSSVYLERGLIGDDEKTGLRLLFSHLEYGRSKTLKSAIEHCNKYSTIRDLIFLGIAGGTSTARIKLLDVVISDKILDCSYERIFLKEPTDDEKRNKTELVLNKERSIYLLLKAETYPVSKRIGDAAKAVSEWSYTHEDEWKELLIGYANQVSVLDVKNFILERLKSKDTMPHIQIGGVWSSDHNVNEPRLQEELSRNFGVKAFEMEGGGLANAALTFGKDFVDIRGISDIDGDRREDTVLQYAASVVASAALDKYLNVIYQKENENYGPQVP